MLLNYGRKKMSDMKRFPLYLPMTTYMQLKEIADYKGIPVTRVIVAILNGYLRSRKARGK